VGYCKVLLLRCCLMGEWIVKVIKPSILVYEDKTFCYL